MALKTLGEIVSWTRDLHQHLSECMQHCQHENESARAQMLLTYLSTHEARLDEVVSGFEKLGRDKALQTWTSEYLALHPIVVRESCDEPYAKMLSDDIVDEILGQHEEIITLYRFLETRAETKSTREIMTFLRELEESEVRVMMQAINRFADM